MKKKIVIAKALLQDRSWVTPNPVFEFFSNVLFVAFIAIITPVYFVVVAYDKIRRRLRWRG